MIKIVPLSKSARGLLQAIYDKPEDLSLRLILGDCLEEEGDPRSELVRLLPKLLSLPERVDLRPDLPCEGTRPQQIRDWRTGGMRTVVTWARHFWPRFVTPIPPGREYSLGRNACYRGFTNLGRLFSLVLEHEVVRLERKHLGLSAPLRHVWVHELEPRYWAYRCYLLNPKERDEKGRLQGNWRFGAYAWMAVTAMHVCRRKVPPRDFKEPYEDYYKKDLESQAEVWGRFLDLHEEFVRICPWQKAEEAWRKAKVPELTYEQRRRRCGT